MGATVVGFLAGGMETRLTPSSGGGDIAIVRGGANQNNGQFYAPASFTVKAGMTVRWVNHDGTTHTATSKETNIFDSGKIPAGGSFSFTFSQPGTYQYYCTLHPWMTGTVVVTAG